MKRPIITQRVKNNLKEIINIIIAICGKIDSDLKERDKLIYLSSFDKYLETIEKSMNHLFIDELIKIDLLKIFHESIRSKYVENEELQEIDKTLKNELEIKLNKLELFIDDYESKSIELTEKLKENKISKSPSKNTPSSNLSITSLDTEPPTPSDESLDLEIGIKEEFSKYLKRHLNLLKRAQHEIEIFKEEKESLFKQASNSVSLAKNIIQDLENEYNSKIIYLNTKKKEIDNQLSLLSGQMINSEYATQSLTEKKTADALRLLSLICLLFVAFIIGYSFYEATSENFTIEKSLIRISFALILTIPAAYLARESNKHRHQQQYLRQTALDLKAIDPYISSLPENERFKIKARFASKVFSTSRSKNLDDSEGTLSTQQLLEKLIEKTEKKEDDFSLPVSSNKLLAKIIERLVKEEKGTSGSQK